MDRVPFVVRVALWKDPDWGMLVWLAMMTGARRGELCALTWDRLDFTAGVLTIRASIAQADGRSWEKDTKGHQQRRVSLDPPTLELLRLYRERRREQAAELGASLPDDAYMFSRDPAGSTWLRPDSVSQRYAKMCRRLGWDMHIHQLRHYSATDLIAAGVDVRTVAGRLGHGGGGATTLRVYSAWVSEADQRAAGNLGARLPALLPVELEALREPGAETPASSPDRDDVSTGAPYRRIAADIRGAITCGILKPGEPLPTVKAICSQYKVSAGTAHRAIDELKADGLATASRGRRATVTTAH